MNHTIDNDEPPSPPPFFRVSGHFTAFNPSRLMVLAAAASKYPSLATTDNTLASSVPDLGEENVSGWPSLDNSFRRIDASDASASSDMSTQDTKILVAKKIKVEMPPLSPITLPTPPDRFLPIILAPVSPKNRVSSRHHVRWSPEEDDLLRTAVGFEAGPPHNWKHIAYTYFRNNRNGLACKGRWTKKLQPGLVSTQWSADEDKAIVCGRKNGLNWPRIAEQLPGRLSEQTRDRFLNHLDPSLNRNPFTDEERQKLFELQSLHGNKWTLIASLLPGRSAMMTKNVWFNAKMSHRRKLRRLATGKEP